jgi:selenocysteine lyase/cysteine desulfurase
MQQTLREIAQYVSVDAEDLVFVQNATQGTNAVMRSFNWEKGDKILCFDIAYVNVVGLLNFLKDQHDLNIVKVELTEEVLQSEDLIVERVKEAIEGNGKIKFAILDHMTSFPATIIPIKRIIDILKRNDIPVFVDGAHVVGQIPLNVTDLDCDFYVSNFHKWGYAPRAATFLYVKKKWQNTVHPAVITHYYGKGFQKEFLYEGVKDMTPLIAVGEALRFRQRFGEEDIMNYMRTLAWEAAKLVARIWGTELLVKDKERVGSLINVRAPSDDYEALTSAQNQLHKEYKTYVMLFKFTNGHYYVRLSAQIWNELSDYENVADEFLKLVNRFLDARSLS